LEHDAVVGDEGGIMYTVTLWWGKYRI
jgi:hypothetical protein